MLVDPLLDFLHFFIFLLIVSRKYFKMPKRLFSTTKQHVKHPYAGQNTQHLRKLGINLVLKFQFTFSASGEFSVRDVRSVKGRSDVEQMSWCAGSPY